MLTAAAGSVVYHTLLYSLVVLTNYILPQLKNKTTVGNVTGKILSSTVCSHNSFMYSGTNTQVYLLSHNKQHSIYLYNFPVTFPYCMLSSFFRLIIKMTEDDLWLLGF